MPFVQRVVEPKYLSRTSLFDEEGRPRVKDDELEAVTNCTLSNALRQLASLVLVANDIFSELGDQLQSIGKRSENLKEKIKIVEEKVSVYDPKKVTVPEGDICTFALLKNHYAAKHGPDTGLFTADTRPKALRALYESANKTPIHLMRQMDRWRRDGHRSSRFFLCTPVLGEKRRKIRNKVDIDIETRMPAAVKELRRWTSSEALGDITVTPDCLTRIAPNITVTDGDATDGTVVSDDEGIDHKLPSPEEQLQVVALKFPAEIVAVDVSGRSFDRMSIQRRSLLHYDSNAKPEEESSRRRTRSRKPRSRRRNTLAGIDQKEIRDALTAGDEPSTSTNNHETESTSIGAVCRSKSSDILRSTSSKKDSPDKKSHFNTLKQWGKNRYDRFMNKNSECKSSELKREDDIDDFNIYETITLKRKRSVEKDRRSHERNPSISSSEKSSVNLPISSPLSSVMNIAVKLRESSAQRRQRRSGSSKDDPPHSSSGNWSASSESGRASIGSEFTTTTQPKSTTSTATSNNSLNQQAPNSVNSRRRFNINTSTSSSVTSEGTLTPDIIHDLHEDGETSSVYSCDTEGYYTSFHMDSGLKTLKEEELPSTPLHSTSAFTNSPNSSSLTAENEYELFGKGSTSTTTSSAGTVCTTLRASDSNRSLVNCPAVPERKSSLTKYSNKKQSPESSMTKDEESDRTGTVKRSPATSKASVIAMVHKEINGDVSPDSGHNTSSSPIESINSPNGIRSGSEFEFSESSDMEGSERIERIRVKTTINSSRIPSMCVITPPHSDDESIKSYSSLNNFNRKTEASILPLRDKLELNLKASETEINLLKSTDSDKENCNLQSNLSEKNVNKIQVINVNPQSGYATIETVDTNVDINKNTKVRAPSPSGGTMIVNPMFTNKSTPSQPIIKASLLPLNNMLGKIKTNLVNLAQRRDSKSPNRNNEQINDVISDCGDYVTLADVRNNNQKSPVEVIYSNENMNKNSTPVQKKVRETEYVSLDELPCNETQNATTTTPSADSLERKKRQGARVTLDAEGKVVYSSDSLRRRKGAHTTFEPGPFVKNSSSPTQSPLPIHRIPKSIRPVTNQDANRPLSPQLGKLIIRATSGIAQTTSEIIRVPSSTIVAPSTRPLSPKPPQNPRGAYVHMQEAGTQLTATQEKGRVSPQSFYPAYQQFESQEQQPNFTEMYDFRGTRMDPALEPRRYLENQYYYQKGNSMYQTLPTKKSQYFQTDLNPERSVTPDITRGLERSYQSRNIDRRPIYYNSLPREDSLLNPKLGIPVRMPDVSSFKPQEKVPSSNQYNMDIYQYTPTKENLYYEKPNYQFQHISPYHEDNNDSIKISPIDPRNTGGFQSSTPSSKTTTDLKAAINLESKLLSPKKSTMSNEELYAVIHKSKKKMNIDSQEICSSPVPESSPKAQTPKQPESGYIGDKSKSRLSWSPTKGEYIDFNSDIDKLSPPNESRSRQSWACTDRKAPCQTSRLDFKKLLLQKSNVLTSTPTKKLSAVEQLKLSKQQIQPKTTPQSPMNILELSGSPRSLVHRRFIQNPPEKTKATPKLMSPRSQWRFANPRTDVLSSTILEDCREDESPNNSIEKKKQVENNVTPKSTNPVVQCDKIPESESNREKPYVSITERLRARRAQFFESGPTSLKPKIKPSNSQLEKNTDKSTVPPTLETAF